MVTYKCLYNVKFYHEYYERFTARDFQIVPSPLTNERLLSFGLIFKQTEQGFSIFYQYEKKRLIDSQKEELTLQFGILVRNKHFETFTESSRSLNEKYAFIDDASFSVAIDNGDSNSHVRLHQGDSLDESSVFRCFYNHDSLSAMLGANVSIQKGDLTIYQGELLGRETGQSILGDQYGIYEVKTDEDSAQLYYLPESLTKVFGVIELKIPGKDITTAQVENTEFQARLASRKVQWNYYFVPEPGKNYDEVDLYLNKEKLSFSNPQNVTLLDGRHAIKVMSEEYFSLKNRYENQTIIARLTSKPLESTEEAHVRELQLPTPDVTRIKGKRMDGAEIYFSDIYIYI